MRIKALINKRKKVILLHFSEGEREVRNTVNTVSEQPTLHENDISMNVSNMCFPLNIKMITQQKMTVVSCYIYLNSTLYN